MQWCAVAGGGLGWAGWSGLCGPPCACLPQLLQSAGQTASPYPPTHPPNHPPTHPALPCPALLQLVFLDVEIKKKPVGRIEMVLFSDVSPRAAENFRWGVCCCVSCCRAAAVGDPLMPAGCACCGCGHGTALTQQPQAAERTSNGCLLLWMIRCCCCRPPPTHPPLQAAVHGRVGGRPHRPAGEGGRREGPPLQGPLLLSHHRPVY